MTRDIIIITCVLIFMVVALYKEYLKPVLVFIACIAILLVSGVIQPVEALSGFSNENIAVVFLLLVLSDILKKTGLLDVSLNNIFSTKLNYRQFMSRLTISVASISGFVNNTPLVAILSPHVYSWAKNKGISPSKVMMPLSFAAIMGGVITLIGTSTNLVVNGLASDAGLGVQMGMFTFTPIGVPLCIIGCIYLIFLSNKFLPSRKDALEKFEEKRGDYLVETYVNNSSELIGKTVDEASLRSLRGLFLMEIIRDNRVITPVTPYEVIEENDTLIFVGETDTIIDLVKNNTGLSVVGQADQIISEKVDVVEVVISTNSYLSGRLVKDSNFRDRFDAAILAVNRNGEKLSGKVGEQELHSGDLLLVTTGKEFYSRLEETKDLIIISKLRELAPPERATVFSIIAGIIVAFVFAATGIMSLFHSLFLLICILLIARVTKIEEIKRTLDFDLMVILALAIGVGKAISVSGADKYFADGIVYAMSDFGSPLLALFVVYLITNLLTMFVTNAAAVAITFPIAISLMMQMGLDTPIPFMLVTALAASADFMTPFGYQTNLMVYGPGGYKFVDYIKFGFPLTLMYMIVSVLGVAYLYDMI
ncbi:MAG TPA: SLC13 family permease [Bacteroidia bacterium]|nr:SLC13 family permease [Bacteroidia bacterium]HNT80740.1 SLC13 family permease [Bacteroidia bacterium]